jgi:hypothetical protein
LPIKPCPPNKRIRCGIGIVSKTVTPNNLIQGKAYTERVDAICSAPCKHPPSAIESIKFEEDQANSSSIPNLTN